MLDSIGGILVSGVVGFLAGIVLFKVGVYIGTYVEKKNMLRSEVGNTERRYTK